MQDSGGYISVNRKGEVCDGVSPSLSTFFTSFSFLGRRWEFLFVEGSVLLGFFLFVFYLGPRLAGGTLAVDKFFLP